MWENLRVWMNVCEEHVAVAGVLTSTCLVYCCYIFFVLKFMHKHHETYDDMFSFTCPN